MAKTLQQEDCGVNYVILINRLAMDKNPEYFDASQYYSGNGFTTWLETQGINKKESAAMPVYQIRRS